MTERSYTTGTHPQVVPPDGVRMELRVERDGHPCWVMSVVLDESYRAWPEAVQYALDQMVTRAIADNFPKDTP